MVGMLVTVGTLETAEAMLGTAASPPYLELAMAAMQVTAPSGAELATAETLVMATLVKAETQVRAVTMPATALKSVMAGRAALAVKLAMVTVARVMLARAMAAMVVRAMVETPVLARAVKAMLDRMMTTMMMALELEETTMMEMMIRILHCSLQPLGLYLAYTAADLPELSQCAGLGFRFRSKT